jgi:Bifunctional DNA primase/polymerase, N-terminal/Primase C terminal 2 (PriCT-2)
MSCLKHLSDRIGKQRVHIVTQTVGVALLHSLSDFSIVFENDSAGLINGIFVVDVDTVAGHGVDGLAALRKLERKHGKLPKTLKAKTPSNGIHFYFRHPGDGIKIVSRAIAPGVDIKGDGGQVAAPPSKNSKGGRYCWLNALLIARAPKWLLEIVQEKERAPRVAISDDELPARETVILALALLPNDYADWKDWKDIGLRIWASTGGTGLDLFIAWSRKWHGYNAADTRKAWDNEIATTPPDRYGPRAIINRIEEVMPEWQTATMSPTYDEQIKSFLGLLKQEGV